MTELARYEEDAPPSPHADLLVPATDSWVASVADVVKLAQFICETPFVPQALRGSAPATAATILYGREIGVAPMTALQLLHVIKGRVGMNAELMRARVLAEGHALEVEESTTALCRIRGRRAGSATWTTVTWTMSDARTAGLGGDGWTKYPRPMLLARASAELCRMVFPDVTHGMMATEELDQAAPQVDAAKPAPRARVSRAKAAKPEPEQAASWQAPPPPSSTPSEPSSTPPAPPLPEPEPLPLAEDVDADQGQGQDDEPSPAALEGSAHATPAQTRMVMALLAELGVAQTREERIHLTQAVIQRRVVSYAQLTITEASRLLTVLVYAKESEDPSAYLEWLVAEGHEHLTAAEGEGE